MTPSSPDPSPPDTQQVESSKRYQVISFRFSEGEVESKELKRLLDLRGVPTFVCNVAEGVSIETEVYLIFSSNLCNL